MDIKKYKVSQSVRLDQISTKEVVEDAKKQIEKIRKQISELRMMIQKRSILYMSQDSLTKSMKVML